MWENTGGATENLRSVKQLPQLLDLSDFPLCIFRLMSSYVVLCSLLSFWALRTPSPSLGRGSFLHGLRQGNYIYSTRQNYGKTVSIYRHRLSMIEKLRIVFFHNCFFPQFCRWLYVHRFAIWMHFKGEYWIIENMCLKIWYMPLSLPLIYIISCDVRKLNAF